MGERGGTVFLRKFHNANESFLTLATLVAQALPFLKSVLALKLSMVAELRFGVASFSFLASALHSKHAALSE